MKTLHVVHPYTFKVENDRLIAGPISQFTSRDESIRDLVSVALDNGKVINYVGKIKGSWDGLLELGAMLCDPLFNWVKDNRIVEITTLDSGVLIGEDKPEALGDEQWEIAKRCFTTPDEMKKLTEDSQPNIFIGGYLENCLANAMGHHQKHFRKNGERVYYVPELCARHNSTPWDEVRPKLEALNVHPMSQEEAMGVFR